MEFCCNVGYFSQFLISTPPKKLLAMMWRVGAFRSTVYVA